MMNNPWKDLDNYKMKRVSSKGKFDIYWLKDLKGNYCLNFRIENAFKNFKSVETKELKTSFSDDNLVIILKDSSNWEIFKVFCDDLVLSSEELLDSNKISPKLYSRINEWKDLLQGKLRKILSLEEQMGLFSEVLTLKELILTNSGNINSWRGPDKDSQDFLCNNCSIEVKSCLSSKRRLATISSKYQLETEKKNLFMIFYSLTKTEKGLNLKQLIDETLKLIKIESDRTIFLKKLLELGYSFEETEYFSFIVDSKTYFDINENFPKLISSNIDNEIVEVKYKIDLSLCNEFLINEKKVLEEL
ncbi:MAG: PD-(D/E)XK motif protein [Cetobacterium sp.]|uniref:PD-(D/E)XK motif protein n=1 Tax=Cetobacterium sp. TaxID=2071632 RepID=UPI002FC7D8E0